ncbi:hypothetical protein [Halomonas rhizosphaerae]|uniref:DUF3108 domain-containing protein n=1 Tax=Halomonas rhizosphaerae TaxID=3043296 RepID=A0ABT6UYG3_9GAMM|nr:hypothetical protein [Halomonas rhizosphaerae]MDI5891017.1 hypothetical protein [Halomonas rhizosphaerae]MDI5921419.1 hypothetical protein [Halomonas rhizosphaerae]
MPAPLRRCAALILLLAAGSALAAEPRPFDARYRLEVAGWPSTTVAHRLSHDGTHWQSDMRAALSVARGHERSRFIAGEAIRSLHYDSGYSLLGIGKDYELDREALAGLPDRQTALFDLSRRAVADDCDTPCRLRYLDHRGREERVDYRHLDRRMLELPAGRFEAVRVEVTEPDAPGRRMVFSFHPDVPGLLLAMEYHRDGERRSRLALTDLTLAHAELASSPKGN